MVVHKTKNVMLFLAFILAGISEGAAQGACKKPDFENTSFGRWFTHNITLNNSNRLAPIDPKLGDDIRSLRLRLDWVAGVETNWRLILRDSEYHLLSVIDAAYFPVSGFSRRRWTARLPSNVVYIELAGAEATDAVFDVATGWAYTAESPAPQQFSTQGPKATWKPVFNDASPELRKLSAVTGMLVTAAINKLGEHVSWCCSGAMVGPNLFLTNWHCGGTQEFSQTSFWNSDVCANTVIDLAWEDNRKVLRQFYCDKVLAKNMEHDFALLQVKPLLGLTSSEGANLFAPLSVTTKPGKAFVIHHASCKPKLFSQCQFSYDGEKLLHSCDTEWGSSGAPIFNVNGEIIGIHHSGFDLDNNCVPIQRINKGTSIKAILEFIKTKHPQVVPLLPVR